MNENSKDRQEMFEGIVEGVFGLDHKGNFAQSAQGVFGIDHNGNFKRVGNQERETASDE